MLWWLGRVSVVLLFGLGIVELVRYYRTRPPKRERFDLIAAWMTIALSVVDAGVLYMSEAEEATQDAKLAELKKHQPPPPRRLAGKTIPSDLVPRLRAIPGTEIDLDYLSNDGEGRDFADDMHDAFDKLGYKVSKHAVVGLGSDFLLEVSTKGEAPFDPLWRFAIYLRDQGFTPTILQDQPKNRVSIGTQRPL